MEIPALNLIRHFPVLPVCSLQTHNDNLIKQDIGLKELTSFCPLVLRVESCTAAVTKGGSITRNTSNHAGIAH